MTTRPAFAVPAPSRIWLDMFLAVTAPLAWWARVAAGGLAAGPCRTVRPDEATAALAHLRALSTDSRSLRFCGAISDAGLVDQAARIADGRLRAVAWVDADADVPFVGLAVYPDPAEMPGPAIEVAVSVLETARGHGVAQALLAAVAEAAIADGKTRLVACTLARNSAMMRLVRRLGGEIVESTGPEVVFELDAREVMRRDQDGDRRRVAGDAGTRSRVWPDCRRSVAW